MSDLLYPMLWNRSFQMNGVMSMYSGEETLTLTKIFLSKAIKLKENLITSLKVMIKTNQNVQHYCINHFLKNDFVEP